MTLNDIIIGALLQSDKGYNEQTVETYRARFTELANEAQSDIARAIGFTHEEVTKPVNGLVDITSLSHKYIKATNAYQFGRNVHFLRTNDYIALPYDLPAIITYYCEPKPLWDPNDVSELPEYTHNLMILYIVGKEREKIAVSQKDYRSIYTAMYEAAKAALRKRRYI